MHLTLSSCAGKKRQRRVRQPKPLEAYCLDMSAVDFSSSQQMRICELPTEGVNITVQGHHPCDAGGGEQDWLWYVGCFC